MSLIKANAVQIGQSPTATQNFTLAVPSSPDGTIKLARGNAGATTQDVLSVDASGNVSFAGGITSGNISSSTAIATGSTTARSLANRFADVVNVLDFGAVGDGVTDDTAAIVAAIQYALPFFKPIVYFPSGEYLVTQIIINSARGITLMGQQTTDSAGPHSILRGKGDNVLIYPSLLTLRSCGAIRIDGLSFNTSGKNYNTVYTSDQNPNDLNIIAPQAPNEARYSVLSRFGTQNIDFNHCSFVCTQTTSPIGSDYATVYLKGSRHYFKNCTFTPGGNNRSLKLGALWTNYPSFVDPIDPDLNYALFAIPASAYNHFAYCQFYGDIHRLVSEQDSYSYNYMENRLWEPARMSRYSIASPELVRNEVIENCAYTADPAKTSLYQGPFLTTSSVDGYGGITVKNSTITGLNYLFNIEKGDAFFQQVRPVMLGSIPDGLPYKTFVVANSNAGNIRIIDTIDSDIKSQNTSSLESQLFEDRRASPKPFIISKNSPSAPYSFTVGSSTQIPSYSTTYHFTGEYVRVSYGICVKNKNVSAISYYFNLFINGVGQDGTYRSITLDGVDTIGNVYCDTLIYVPPTTSAVTIELRGRQVTAGTSGIIPDGSAGNIAQSSFSIELLQS